MCAVCDRTLAPPPPVAAACLRSPADAAADAVQLAPFQTKLSGIETALHELHERVPTPADRSLAQPARRAAPVAAARATGPAISYS